MFDFTLPCIPSALELMVCRKKKSLIEIGQKCWSTERDTWGGYRTRWRPSGTHWTPPVSGYSPVQQMKRFGQTHICHRTHTASLQRGHWAPPPLRTNTAQTLINAHPHHTASPLVHYPANETLSYCLYANATAASCAGRACGTLKLIWLPECQ